MNLIHYSPPRSLDAAFDHLFPEFWPSLAGGRSAGGARAFLPRVEIRDEQEAVVLSAELPGVEKDAVKVELKEGVLTISGEKKGAADEEGNGVYRSERSYGAFERRFSVPNDLDGENAKAAFDNGVLTLTLPKKPEAKAHLIAIGNGKA